MSTYSSRKSATRPAENPDKFLWMGDDIFNKQGSRSRKTGPHQKSDVVDSGVHSSKYSLRFPKGALSVIAPYLRLRTKKQHEVRERLDEKRRYDETQNVKKRVWSFRPTFFKLGIADYFHAESGCLGLTANALKKFTNAASCVIYLVDEGRKAIYQYERFLHSQAHKISLPIGVDGLFASYVASTLGVVIAEDVLADCKYPSGLGWKESVAAPSMGVPVIADEEVVLLFELSKDAGEMGFGPTDRKAADCLSNWIGANVYLEQHIRSCDITRQVCGFLIEIIRVFSSDPLFSKYALDVHNTTFLLMSDYNQRGYTQGITYEEVWDNDKQVLTHMLKRKIFLKDDKSVLAKCVISGSRIHSKGETSMTGHKASSCLTVPINLTVPVGAIQLASSAEEFSEDEILMAEMFADYIALAMFNERLKHKCETKKVKCELLYEMLKYRADVYWESDPIEEIPTFPITNAFFFFNFSLQNSCMCPVIPFRQLLSFYARNMFESYNQLCSFACFITKLLSMRPSPHLNYGAAFYGLHTFCLIVMQNEDFFTNNEKSDMSLALAFHSLAGEDNINPVAIRDIMRLFTKPDESLGSVSDVCDRVLGYVRKLTMYEGVLAFNKLLDLVKADQFNWRNKHHRTLMKTALLIVCHISFRFKSCAYGDDMTEVFYEKFIFDNPENFNIRHVREIRREEELKVLHVARSEVSFIEDICLPWIYLINVLFPSSQPLFDIASSTLSYWNSISHPRTLKEISVRKSYIDGSTLYFLEEIKESEKKRQLKYRTIQRRFKILSPFLKRDQHHSLLRTYENRKWYQTVSFVNKPSHHNEADESARSIFRDVQGQSLVRELSKPDLRLTD